ncbi:unnamed protein product [Cylindrotheca closterium]|uniref:Uncharacterized protein n=1 Tax=Cylindrotheca closterium TaxID=2856 RepID=A0AAD2G3M5_9STRA|nr:unnamed protein product [Cylindrotheca closterium]
MGKGKIAVFGVGGSIGKGLIPLLVNANYDKFKVLVQKDETKSFLTRQDVIFRGEYYLERDAVIDSMKGCKKVMLALPRTLKRLELIGYAKFIGECSVAARVPTLIRLAVADYDTMPETSEDVENFRLLDEYLDTLAIEVVTIQSGTMVSGKWSTPKINRRRKRQKQQAVNVKETSSKTTSKTKKDEDDFIGLSVTFDSTSEEASPSPNAGGGGQPPASAPPTPAGSGLWNLLASGGSRPGGATSPTKSTGPK